MATAKEKKEEVKASLKILRAELRKMHLGVTEELALPEPTEVKKLMNQMEELLVVIEPKSSRKSKREGLEINIVIAKGWSDIV